MCYGAKEGVQHVQKRLSLTGAITAPIAPAPPIAAHGLDGADSSRHEGASPGGGGANLHDPNAPMFSPRSAAALAASCPNTSGTRLQNRRQTFSADSKRFEEATANSNVIDESVAGILFRARYGVEQHVSKSQINAHASEVVESAAERAAKLSFFESLFYQIDEDATQYISEQECDLMLSYVLLDIDPTQRHAVFKSHDSVADGRLNRVEFVALCFDVLWHVPRPLIEIAMSNVHISRKAKQRNNKVHWEKMASKLDSWARVTIPVAYGFCLVIIFNIELKDPYTEPQNVEMFDGVGEVIFSVSDILWMILYLLAIAVVTVATYFLNRAAQRRQMDAKQLFRNHESAGKKVRRQSTCARMRGAQPADGNAFTAPGHSRTEMVAAQ